MSDYIRHAFDGDDVVKKNLALRKAHDEIERLRAEVEAQARLNGMGAERELALQAKVERLQAALAYYACKCKDGNCDTGTYGDVPCGAIASVTLGKEKK